MSRELAWITICAFVVVAWGCDGDRKSAESRSTSASGSTAQDGPTIRFRDASLASGIDLHNVNGEVTERLAIIDTVGQGLAILDFDRDGLLDVFVANGDVQPGQESPHPTRCGLYRNLGDHRFEDVTERAGLVAEGWFHGASAIDFDADGFTDLYLTAYGGPNRFLRNLGDGRFEDATRTWGGGEEGPSTAAVFFDADQDGDLDLYVGAYVQYDADDPPNDGNPCRWMGLDVFCGPRGTVPGADCFLENREGRLEEASATFGFAEVRASYTLGAVAFDVEGDGDMDLYVANDSESNYLFENRTAQGGPRFVQVALELGVGYNEDGRAQAGMGVDCGDVDNDGRLDLFVTNFSQDCNTLYRNLVTPAGRTLFEDVSYSTGIGTPSFAFLSWGTRILDLDHDGWQDVIVVSGHVYPQVDQVDVGTTFRQRNQVFRNRGLGEARHLGFEELLPGPQDAFAKVACSRGLAAADFDDDGDADLLVVELDDRPTLMVNETEGSGHWIGFHLTGGSANLEAIGARVEVEDSLGVVRLRERSGGGSFLSSGDPRVVFGLGEAGGPVRRVSVRWPSGATSELASLAVDEYWRIEEGSSGARSAARD